MPIDTSKFFDSIRINKRSAKQETQVRETATPCEWPDCKNKGSHRAPKGRDNSREYWHFCLDHVREYNQSYNFFAGMSDDAVEACVKDNALLDKLKADQDFAYDQLKVDATPTFFINGERVKGSMSFEDFEKKLAPLLKR